MMMPQSADGPPKRRRLSFARVAAALEETRGAPRAAVVEVLRGLLEDARASDEAEALLRLLLPTEDRARAYGVRTRGWLRAVGDALAKAGRPDTGARLRAWTPVPCRGERGVICAPELAVVAAIGQLMMPSSAPSSAPLAPMMTVTDIGATCDRLALLWLTPEARGAHAHTARVEELLLLMRRTTDGPSWALFMRVLLRRAVVGPALVYAALWPSASSFYARQRSLAALARAAAEEEGPLLLPRSSRGPVARLECGTPFTPMTAAALRAPYLLKWIFSREERLRRPITPVDGRLVILLPRASAVQKDGLGGAAVVIARWYAPMSGANKMRMVDIDDDRVLAVRSRRRHMLLLRALRRADLIDPLRARGLVLHYTLSVEDGDGLVCLLRAVSNAREAGVELVDEEEIDDEDDGHTTATDDDEEEEEDLGAARGTRRTTQRATAARKKAAAAAATAARLRALIRQPSADDENESEVVMVARLSSDTASTTRYA